MTLCLLVIFHLQKKQKHHQTTHGIKTQKAGVILALDKETGKKLWEFNVNAPIGHVGPSIGDGMLFVPTGKIEGLPREERVGGIRSCIWTTMRKY